MRAILALLFSACIATASGCDRLKRGESGRIDVDEEVTSPERVPHDPIFTDFENTWRKLISDAPELAMPVVIPPKRPQEPEWNPVVEVDCVFSAAAGGLVPQVTLIWNEPVTDAPGPGPGPVESTAQQEQQRGGVEVPMRRVDLALLHDGFAKNHYTSILSGSTNERFKLPPDSGFVDDAESMLRTGPGLFPRLLDSKAETLADRDSGRRFVQRTLVLQELSQGLSYTIRIDRSAGSEWNEDRRYTFLTPVCPSSF